ncbi:hypothetical protein V6N13_015195 [Hibiscus sabdariffa]
MYMFQDVEELLELVEMLLLWIPLLLCQLGLCDLHLPRQNSSTPCCYGFALLMSGTLSDLSIAGKSAYRSCIQYLRDLLDLCFQGL